MLLIRYLHPSASVETVPVEWRVFWKENIDLQTGCRMDDVELESLFDGVSHGIAVKIVLLFRKAFFHSFDLVFPDISDDIDIMGKAGFAVQYGCDRAGNKIGNFQ